ncbi:MAG: hypothetical protein IT558_06670 [Alphaproteobacteria bacterium]|nr:hypothetical protein [Alphaproteobacteria bacterium]
MAKKALLGTTGLAGTLIPGQAVTVQPTGLASQVGVCGVPRRLTPSPASNLRKHPVIVTPKLYFP